MFKTMDKSIAIVLYSSNLRGEKEKESSKKLRREGRGEIEGDSVLYNPVIQLRRRSPESHKWILPSSSLPLKDDFTHTCLDNKDDKIRLKNFQ